MANVFKNIDIDEFMEGKFIVNCTTQKDVEDFINKIPYDKKSGLKQAWYTHYNGTCFNCEPISWDNKPSVYFATRYHYECEEKHKKDIVICE